MPLTAKIIEGHLTITLCYELAIAAFSSASVLLKCNSCHSRAKRVLKSSIYFMSDSEVVTFHQHNSTIYMQKWNHRALCCQNMKE